MISPDGSTLYYLDVEPGRAGIWTASIDGQNPIQMVSGHIASSYGSQAFLSPDGNHLAYFMYEGLKTTLYTLPVNGGSARKLFTSDHQQGQTPAWSPDSEEIAFVDGKDLFVISAQGGRPESIATSKEWEGWMVEWSPNGRHVAGFGFEEGEENNVLYIVDRDSKERKRVTPPEESGYKEIFNWHPDGDRISYMYYGPDWERDGSQVISIDGGAPKPFAQMPAPMWDYVGVWGPDHRYYFISVGWNNAWGLYSTDEESNEFTTIRQLSDRSVNLPNWSEDGSVIAWSETESSRQLWMLTDYE